MQPFAVTMCGVPKPAGQAQLQQMVLGRFLQGPERFWYLVDILVGRVSNHACCEHFVSRHLYCRAHFGTRWALFQLRPSQNFTFKLTSGTSVLFQDLCSVYDSSMRAPVARTATKAGAATQVELLPMAAVEMTLGKVRRLQQHCNGDAPPLNVASAVQAMLPAAIAD